MPNRKKKNVLDYKELERSPVHNDFVKRHGHLSIKTGSTIYKFCSGCSHKLKGDQVELKKHCDRNPECEQYEFLKFNEWPKSCKWKNFMEYRSDPNVEL